MSIYWKVCLLLAVTVLVQCKSTPRTTGNELLDLDFSYRNEDYDGTDENEEVLFSEERSCPRDCICTMVKEHRTAQCTRLAVGMQKFGEDINDLVIEDIDAKHPIILDDMMFKKLGLHQLSTLKIVNSTVAKISASAFHGLHEIFDIDLSGNKIRKIPPQTFANNKKLVTLTLSNNPLKMPPRDSDEYFLNSTVQELCLANSGIKYLTRRTFSEMDNLIFINLADNLLTELDSTIFENLIDLEELDLSNNALTSLPSNLFEYVGISILNIQGNPISSVYGLQIPDLMTLNAGSSQFKFVGPSMFNGMQSLVSLNLSGNAIEKIHNQVFHNLLDLNFLDLSNNNLKQNISNVLIQENVELEIFKIANNSNLKTLPVDGFVCSVAQFGIYLFDASGCGLEVMPDNSLKTFTALSQINLSNNKLQYLSEKVFSFSPKLVDINLANNLLESLEKKVFAQNKDLSKLSLHGNPLKTISVDIFIHTPQLKWLDMSGGELQTLWEEKDNHPAALLNNLQFLNVSNNNIRQIRSVELHMIEKLNTLDVNNNPLQCDRAFEELMSWLSEHKVSTEPKGTEFANLEEEAEKIFHDTYNWETLEQKTCDGKISERNNYTTDSPPIDEDIWEKIVPNNDTITKTEDKIIVTNKDISYDMEDNSNDYDEDEDDEDQDEEVMDDGNDDIEIDVKLFEANGYIRKFEDRVGEIISENGDSHNPYNYLWAVLIVVLSALLILLVIGKVVMMVCKKESRRVRYNNAIIAAMSHATAAGANGRTKKDCGLVYQQLSEDFPGPRTPIVTRYATHAPVHNTNIVPEAV